MKPTNLTDYLQMKPVNLTDYLHRGTRRIQPIMRYGINQHRAIQLIDREITRCFGTLNREDRNAMIGLLFNQRCC